MKLLVCGDLHWRGNNPRSRVDDFPATLRSKLCEVLDTALKEHNVDGIIIPGDLFDAPAAAFSTVGALASILRLTNRPIYTVPGNHDLWSHNPSSMPRTAYGLLKRLDLIRCLHGLPAIHNQLRTVITGRAFDAESDRSLDHYVMTEFETPLDPDMVHIHVAHGMVLESSPGYEVRHTLLSDIAAHPDAPDVLITGHEHLGYGVRRLEKADGTEMLAVNPGALCRLSAHPAEIERTVQVVLLDIRGKQGGLLDVDAELIPLKSARPGHEVLSREHLEAQADREAQMEKFLDLLASEGEARFLEIEQIVEDIARREQIPTDVVEEALSRIGRAREELEVRGS